MSSAADVSVIGTDRVLRRIYMAQRRQAPPSRLGSAKKHNDNGHAVTSINSRSYFSVESGMAQGIASRANPTARTDNNEAREDRARIEEDAIDAENRLGKRRRRPRGKSGRELCVYCWKNGRRR